MSDFATFILVLAVVAGAAAYIAWSSRTRTGALPPAATPDDDKPRRDKR